jgi:hypothetical protein
MPDPPVNMALLTVRSMKSVPPRKKGRSVAPVEEVPRPGEDPGAGDDGEIPVIEEDEAED